MPRLRPSALALTLTLGAAPLVAARPALVRARSDAPATALAHVPLGAATCDAATSDHGSSSIQIHADDEQRTTMVRFHDGACDITLYATGTFTLRDDLTDVATIADGFVRVTEDDGSHVRRYQVSPGTNGALERRYTVDGAPHEFDADAQRWLAGILLAVERRTAFDAPGRVHSLLARGGPDAVLDEIGHIRGDYASRVYITTLLDSARLSESQAGRLIAQAGRDIGSDYELRQVLDAVGRHGLVTAATMPVYVTAIDSIQSDYERRQALSALLDGSAAIPPALAGDILRVGSRIDSDYEESEFLIAAAKRGLLTDATRQAFFDGLKGIQSDYEQRRVLTTALTQGQPDRELVLAALRSVPAIQSDYDRTETLVAIARAFPLDSAMRQAYIAAADGIHSDYDHHRALSALLRTSEDRQ